MSFPILKYLLLISILKIVLGTEQNQQCAILHKEGDLEGAEFPVRNDDSFSNLEGEFLSSDSVWNITSSVKIQSGCLFTGCNESYFAGQCLEFKEDLTALPEGFENILSVNCTCAQNCKCSDIKPMRRNSCARAYLYDGGCNRCNPQYTDLKGTLEVFSEEFETKVKSLMVRPGCQLTVYDDLKFQGEVRIIQGTEENWNSPIGSYECGCDEEAETTVEPTVRPEHYPPLIDIPDTVDEISAMINGDYGRHPGLLAALQSLRNKRSPRNAYILLLGSTGAGKSSTINLLFDNPNVTLIGGEKSTTKNIHEFRIPIQVDEFGIRNSELRVIDTPGLGDTKGIEVDAKFLATLEDFLNGHEELKDRMPNVVLIFHKFDDNRYDGEGSNFVKMIRGLDYFRTRITDKKFSNCIFVFSHFTSEKQVSRNPKAKLANLARVIAEYSQFPKPIVLAAAENKGVEQDLQMVNGYFKLPNGDYYPRNLFDKIQRATEGGGDVIGEAVIRTAFRNPDDFKVTERDFKLVDQKNSNVPKFLGILSNAIYTVNKTEISQLLEKAYEKMDPELQTKYPDVLYYVQKALNLRNIGNKADIPRTTTGIVQLITDLKQNEGIYFLLKTAFDIEPPAMKENVLTGYSYNVFKDIPLPVSPFNLGELIGSDIGYKFPNIMTCIVDSQSKDVLHFIPNRAAYLEKRLHNLNVGGRIPLSEFTGAVKPGYNVEEDLTNANGTTNVPVTAVRELRTFELVLNDRLTLTKKFTSVIKSLTPLNESDHVNVDQWKNFFNEYGTHVVKSIHGGGGIEISVRSTKPFSFEMSNVLMNFVQFAEDISIGKIGNSSLAANTEDVQHNLKFIGGDKSFHTTDLTKMTLQDASSLLEKWKESLRLDPTILTNEMRLMPISEIVKRVGQNISSEIERATGLLFNSSLKYTPPPPAQRLPPPETRESVDQMNTMKMFQDFMDRMHNESRRNEERFNELMQQNLEQQKAAQEQRLQWEKEKLEMLRLQQERDREDQRNRELGAEERRRADDARRTEERRARDEIEKRRQDEEREYRRQMEESRRRHDEQQAKLMIAIANRPQPSGGGGGCLKQGTKILMADQSEKSVEDLQIGEMILDHNLTPTRVAGVLQKFLMTDGFYGFDNQSYFFTDSHLMAGPPKIVPPAGLKTNEVQLYVQNNYRLLKENPLMLYLNVEEFSDDSEESENSGEQLIFAYDKGLKSVQNVPVTIFQEQEKYKEETLVYIILLESKIGTYFANGYACRHELPPLDHWKNSMSVLFKLVSLPELKRVENVPHTLENVKSIQKMIGGVQKDLRLWISPLTNEAVSEMEVDSDEKSGIEEEETEISEGVILEIFDDPTYSAFAVGIYGELSLILADKMDANESLEEENIRKLQRSVFRWLRERFNKELGSRFPSYFN